MRNTAPTAETAGAFTSGTPLGRSLASPLGRRGLLGLAATATAGLARAETPYPNRPIRMFVPWTAGGISDVQMRALASGASQRLGQPIVAENRTGASGAIAAQQLLNERPDGYCISQMPESLFLYPFMSPRPAFDPIRDFTYIIQVANRALGMVVRADAPWTSVQGLIDYAAANPGKINIGTPGVGTVMHIVIEEIAAMRGLEWTHVPFRGGADSLNALLAGQIQAVIDSGGWAEQVLQGQMRLLATLGPTRSRRFPDAPTLRESGVDLEATSAYGFVGPRGMDPAVVRQLHDAFHAALEDPAHLQVLERYNMEIDYLNTADYEAHARRRVEASRAVMQRVGARLI
ncbi:tripartite tricarboxylate transporter substrate binding protein [Roseomonas sp. BN140053]|uniref:tripartite tricarboxylate transporter substrate binding protein n=1 Tax=Roseomonas sp. BN140053 TaxID=3391898 RepID=UPI0039ECC273